MSNLNLQTGILKLGESEILIKYELDGERDYNYPNWRQFIPESKTILKVDSFAFDTVLTAKFKEMIEVFSTTKYGPLVVYPLKHKNYIAIVMPCRVDDTRDHGILDTIRNK
jgi:DNA polymerase III sliding clamp (beta) subunit (PCNA family)